jgi:small nuclear ribonucleoprotein (snRNP)-like protein
MDGFNYFVKKKVFIILKNKREYTGIVNDIEDLGNGLLFIHFTDKFGQRIIFASGEIEVMEEEKQ